jgi:hypothetical protein
MPNPFSADKVDSIVEMLKDNARSNAGIARTAGDDPSTVAGIKTIQKEVQ